MSTKNLGLILLTILLLAFFVWPGQWKFDKIGDVPMRTNRFTGRSELFAAGGWKSIGDQDDGSLSTSVTRMLDPFEQEMVTGQAGVDQIGYFKGALYNGTSCTITRVVYRVVTRIRKDTSVRDFSETEYIPSRQTKDVIFQAHSVDNNREFVGWGIDSVEAQCPRASIR